MIGRQRKSRSVSECPEPKRAGSLGGGKKTLVGCDVELATSPDRRTQAIGTSYLVALSGTAADCSAHAPPAEA